MSHHVKDYMTKGVNSVDYDATITEAANIMVTDKDYEGYARAASYIDEKGLIVKWKKELKPFLDLDKPVQRAS
jgi:CBS domain-containing protein